MEIKDKLYKVNRDDRSSSIETHRFIILELNAIISLGYHQLLYFGNMNKRMIDPSGALKHMNEDKTKFTYYSGYGDNNYYVVQAESVEEAATIISAGDSRKVYVTKEEAGPELKELLTGQLQSLIRNKETLQESIDLIQQCLEEL